MSITADSPEAVQKDLQSLYRRTQAKSGHRIGTFIKSVSDRVGVSEKTVRRAWDGEGKRPSAKVQNGIAGMLNELEAKTARKAELAKHAVDAAKGRLNEADMEHIYQSISSGIETLENGLDRLKFRRD